MKVYLATSGSYSDYRVRGVFARREDAESYELADDVEEFDLHEGPQEVRSWHRLLWYPDLPEPDYEWSRSFGSGRTPNPQQDPHPERCDYDGHLNRVKHRWTRGWGEGGSGHLEVTGWDIERIRKVFGELRAEWLNCKTLGMQWDADKLEWAAPTVEG